MGFGLRMNLGLSGGSGGVVDTGPPSAIVNIPQFNVITDFTAPTVAAQQVAVATIPQFNVITNFTPPVVTTEAGDTAIYAATSYSIDYMQEDGTFATVRNNPTGNVGADGPAQIFVATSQDTNDHEEVYTSLDMSIYRSFLAFTIPQGSAYSTVVLHLNAEEVLTNTGSPNLHIQQGTQATLAAATEYDAFTGAPNGTSFGNTGTFSTTGEKTITMSAGGLTYLNGIRATGGTAKLVIRTHLDQTNTAPTLDGTGYFVALTGSGGTGTIRPKLVVT